jgi:pimeloyl-ACP methyl ester carboxylesterase
MLLSFDRADELSAISAPVLVLGAIDDAIVPVAHSRDLVCRLSKARLIEMQGGHFLPQTQTGAYVAALETFLNDPA